jgi:hypothetical protein
MPISRSQLVAAAGVIPLRRAQINTAIKGNSTITTTMGAAIQIQVMGSAVR